MGSLFNNEIYYTVKYLKWKNVYIMDKGAQ
jgi:hypothetical protein